MLGHFLTLAVNLVGIVAAILLLRFLADRRWLVALVGVNLVVVTRRFYEIGMGFDLVANSEVVNVFGVPFVHALCVTTATVGVLRALRHGDSSLFRLQPECEARYRQLMKTADRLERQLGGAVGGR